MLRLDAIALRRDLVILVAVGLKLHEDAALGEKALRKWRIPLPMKTMGVLSEISIPAERNLFLSLPSIWLDSSPVQSATISSLGFPALRLDGRLSR